MRLRPRRPKHQDPLRPIVVPEVTADLNRGGAILGRLPWTAWRSFDRDMRARTMTAPDWIPGWWTITPSTVVPYCTASEKPVLTAALLSMHPNGHVREKAVCHLASLGRVESAPALLLRSTDWVAQVREAAADGLRQLRDTLRPEDLIPALALLEPPRWASRSRDEALDEIRPWLLSSLGSDQIIAALKFRDPKVRQAAARILVQRGECAVALTTALAQSDAATATIIANGLSPTDWADADLMNRALEAKFSQVVSTALAWLQLNAPERAVEVSSSLLLSRSATTRFLAQHFLRMHGVDTPSIYRAALSTHPRLALVGLGEVGDVSDSQRVAAFLGASEAAQRAAATTALGRLAGRTAEERLCTILGDPSPRVARAASWALIRLGPSSNSVELAWQVALTAQTPGNRTASFRLFASCGRWTALRLACRAILASDADLAERGHALLAICMKSWNRSFTNPPASDRSELKSLIVKVIPHLPPTTAEIVTLSVKPYLDFADGEAPAASESTTPHAGH